MPLPLYSDAKYGEKELNTHKGLWFERFFNRYTPNDWEVKVSDQDNPKKDWISLVAGKCGSKEDLAAYALKQRQLCHNLQGDSQIYKNNWHFATGMGNPHPVENGFTWHPTLGVPYLSGAAVKGIIRTWIEEWADYDPEKIAEISLKWFGSETKDSIDNQAGQFIFFDAIPVTEVTLACDVITPHMGKWYSDGGQINQDNYNETVPADWHSPNIIPFLVAKDISLQFCIAPRNEEAKAELAEVMLILKLALEYLGAGAKTATGYGRLLLDEKRQKEFNQKMTVEHCKTLPPIEAFKEELKTLDDDKIAIMFGKKFNKNRKKFGDKDWYEMVHILAVKKASLIEKWQAATDKNSGPFKAYRRIMRVLNAD